MAEIVNLRLARKRKARDAAAEAAAQARATHGRSKAEKTLARARADKAERDIEAHRLAAEPASDRATGPVSGPVDPQTRDTGTTKPD